MSRNDCPSLETLSAFALGDLPEPELGAVAEHLDACTECDERATRLDGMADAVVCELRRLPNSDVHFDGAVTEPAGSAEHATFPAPTAIESWGEFRIVREIGRGGMGVVCEAYQGSLNRRVALKFLPEHGDLARFRREARAAGRLHHTNIVPVFGVGQQQGRHFYVMQFIAGRGLDAVLKQRAGDGRSPARFDDRETARIGVQVAEALAYAHAQGVTHRDIKPSNLLIDDQGTVWVTDFGLAHDATDTLTLTHSGDFLGTLRYVAPERLTGPGDERADAYGLGVTLYELVCGRPAFFDLVRSTMLYSILHEDPPRPRQLDSRIARDLETIVLKAIEKDPRRRYQSAGEMADDLRRFLDGEPIRARQINELERAWKWAMRRKTVAGLLLLAVVSLVGGMAASVGFSFQVRHYAALADARARDASDAATEAARVAADGRAASALAAAEAGEIDRGLYGLIDALEIAPDVTPTDRARRQALRRSLAAWMAAQPVLRHAIDGLDRDTRVVLAGPARTVANLIKGRRLRRFDLATGRSVGAPGGVELPAPILAVSPDGSMVVTAAEIPGRSPTAWDVRVIDAGSGRKRAQLPPLESEQIERDVIFDPDGRYIGLKVPAAGRVRPGDPYVRRVWRLDTASPAGPPGGVQDRWTRTEVRMIATWGGHAVLVYPEPAQFRKLVFSDRLLFWDLDDGRPLDRLEQERSTGVKRCGRGYEAYLDASFDGTCLVYAQDNGLVRWWDVATGRPARPDWQPHRASSGAELSDDGRTLAVHCDDNRVRYYDLASGRECGPAPVLRGGRASVGPGGPFLLARRGGGVLAWQVGAAPRLAHANATELSAHWFAALAAPPDGAEYAVGAARANGSTMGRDFLWRAIKTLGRNSGGRDGQRLATADGRPLGAGLDPLICHPCYSPDGRLFAACRTGAAEGDPFLPMVVAVWDRATGQTVLPWTTVPQFIHGLAFSPDGRTLAAGCVAGVWLLDLTSRRPPRFLAQQGPIPGMEFSPDSRRLAAGARSGWGAHPGVRLWDVASGRPVGEDLRTGELPWFRFAPDGESLLVLDPVSRRLARIHAEDGRQIAPTVSLPGLDAESWGGDRPEGLALSWAVAFRLDGAAIAESATASTARQYDVYTRRPIGPVMDHGDTISLLAYSPDGETLVSACSDGTVRLWDAPTGRPLGPPLVHGLPALGLFFNPEATTLNVVAIDGKATSWPVPRPVAVADPATLRLWVETVTGLRQAEGGEFLDLAPDEWRLSRQRLGELWPEAIPGPDGREALARWHWDRADDARRAGNRFAYRQHLEQLEALEPSGWLPSARLAADFSDAGHFAEAAAEYERAARLATAEDLTAWHWSQAAEHLASGRADVAAWYLDKVAAARPDDWRAHAHRAKALDRLGRSTEAAAERDRAMSTGADALYIAEVAGDRAGLGDWEAATRLANLAAARGAGDPNDRALICLRCGDRAGYRRACASLLSSIAAVPAYIFDATKASWTIGLAPGAVDDYTRPLEFADSIARFLARLKAPENYQARQIQHDARQARAAVLIRAGRTGDGLAELAKSVTLVNNDPADDLLAAIAHARTGQVTEAKARFAKALTAIASESAQPTPWQRKAELDVLRTEAQCALLDLAFPAKPFAQ